MATGVTKTSPYPARAARIACRLPEDVICRRARVSRRYLQRLEREGTPSYDTARRIASVIGCDIKLFLPPARDRDEKSSGRVRAAKAGRGAATSPSRREGAAP